MKFVNEKVFYKCFLVSNIPFDGIKNKMIS